MTSASAAGPFEGAGRAPRPGGDRLRVLVVNWLDRENPRSGGAEIHLHQTFGRLAARGHEVTVLVSGWPGCAPRASLDGLDVHRTGGRHTFSLAAPRYYRRKLAGAGFDVIVEDLNKVPVFTPWWGDVPVLALVHHLFGATAFQAGPFPVALATWLLEHAIPRAYRGVPVVAVSESTRDDLVERGLPAEHVEVIHNGIDLGLLAPDPEESRFPEPTLVFVGRLKEYKRVDLPIRAVARLADEGTEVRLLVAGAGEQRASLEALAARLGVSDRVRFLGFVTEERKAEILRKGWLHVLTSEKEGWGISNLEAAACGTPTVASDAPGLRESVVHGETGWLVPHDDLDALTRALRALLQDAARRRKLAEGARRFAERFSWDATAEAMEEALRRVVGRPALG